MCLSIQSMVDSGPRFLIANVVSAVLHITFAVLLLVVEIQLWGIYFFSFALVGALANGLCLRAKWRNSRSCGDSLGLMALLHFGHVVSSIPLQSSLHTRNRYTLQGPFSTIGFFFLAFIMTGLTLWHKKVVFPSIEIDESQSNSPRVDVPPSLSHDHQHSHGKSFFTYSVGPLAVLVFGLGESRLASGLVPVPHTLEGIIGICTAALICAFYHKRYRQSAWCSVISILWVVVSVGMFVIACAMYGVKSKEGSSNYGVSLFVCFFYAFGFCAAFSFKFCLLKEHLHLNFSRPPVDNTKMQETTIPNNPYPTTDWELEAQPYGMTRLEAAATARKLGYSDTDRVLSDMSLATDTSKAEL